MKLKRASFNRCIYSVDERNICWDVRAFVDVQNKSDDEDFIISLNLVVQDYEKPGPYDRVFLIKKVRVYFGTEMVYQGKDFDHKEWLGPSLNSTSNMIRLNKELMGDETLSVVVLTEDDLGRTYECEAGDVKIGVI